MAMAYVPLLDPRKNPALQTGVGESGTAPGVSSTGSTPPPAASDAGQKFGALRSFFAANQPVADAQANAIVAPIEKTAESAVADTNMAVHQLPDASKVTADRAIASRDDAAQKLEALKTPGGIAGLLGSGADATYTEGQRAMDAALFGRTSAIPGAVDRWGGVLGALEPTYTTGVREAVQPHAPGPVKPVDPYARPSEDRPTIDPRTTDPSMRGRARTLRGA